MQCICPNCKKKTSLTPDELRTQGGQVVCPRCLTVFRVPLPADAGGGDGDVAPPPVPKAKKPVARAKGQPKPKPQPSGREVINFVNQQQPARQPRVAQSRPQMKPTMASAKRKQPSKQAKQPSGSHKPMSMIGCALNTALAVIVLFAAYFLIGNLF